MKNREILTPTQNAQEALVLERERDRPNPRVKEFDSHRKQKPTPDAVTVLQNESGRRKEILSRRKRNIAPSRRSKDG